MRTLFAFIGIVGLLATNQAAAQSRTATYSCRTINHIHAPDTHDCTYTSSSGYSSTQSCGYVEHIGAPREYACSDTTTIDQSATQSAATILRGR